MKARGWRLLMVVASFIAVSTVLMSVSHSASSNRRPLTTQATSTTATTYRAAVAAPLPQPVNLTSNSMSITAAPVAVPMTVTIPSIAVQSHVLAVGMTAAHAMFAPEGGPNSPNWGDTFGTGAVRYLVRQVPQRSLGTSMTRTAGTQCLVIFPASYRVIESSSTTPGRG